MLTKNYNEKQVAALCLTNIITNFEVLRELECVNHTEYQIAVINMMFDNISRLTGAITLTEESGVASELVSHAKTLIEAVSTSTTEEMALFRLAKDAVHRFQLEVWKTENTAERKAEKGEK